MSGIVLWENPNPTANFVAQTITLPSDDYDIIEVYYKMQPTANFMLSTRALKGYSIYLNFAGGETGSGPINAARALRCDSPTTYYAAAAQRSFGDANTINNGYVIPIKIIGYKS